MTDPAKLIERLALQPHPEGGWFRETWRGPDGADGRSIGTAILFLLEADQISHWHRVDADEMWFWHAGSPLDLMIAGDERGPIDTVRLGGDPLTGQSVHARVSKHHWQAARPIDGWVLVSCTVTPGFSFDGFELAPEGWEPGSPA